MTQLRAIHLLALVVAISAFKESSSMFLPSLPRVKPLLHLPLSSHLQKLFPQYGPCGKPCCTTTPACENCENRCNAPAVTLPPLPSLPPVVGGLVTTLLPPVGGLVPPVGGLVPAVGGLVPAVGGLVPAVVPAVAPVVGAVPAAVPAVGAVVGAVVPAAAPVVGAAPAVPAAAPVLGAVGPQPLSADGNDFVLVPRTNMYRVKTRFPVPANCPGHHGRVRPPAWSKPRHFVSVPETDATMESILEDSGSEESHHDFGDGPLDAEQLNKAKLQLIIEVQRLLKLISSSPPPPPPPAPVLALPERNANNGGGHKGGHNYVECGQMLKMQCMK